MGAASFLSSLTLYRLFQVAVVVVFSFEIGVEWSGGVLEVPERAAQCETSRRAGEQGGPEARTGAHEREGGREAYIIHVCDI